MVNDVDEPMRFAQSVLMNYRHAYHAGNHGDVLKHAILARVLTYMTTKDKPLTLLDAHAGIGRYDLSGVEAFKTGEWQGGIARLVESQLAPEINDLLLPYLSHLQSLNPKGGVQHYPGSPDLARALLRQNDRLLFNELHPEDRLTLAARFRDDGRVRISGVDALQVIKASLPFAERRGVVLIDPSYEVAEETERVSLMVQHALRRMAKVVVLVWYPVTTTSFADAVCDAVKQHVKDQEALDARLMVREPHKDAGLAGSGMIIINPPWKLEEELNLLLPALAKMLGNGRWGNGSVTRLTPPKP